MKIQKQEIASIIDHTLLKPETIPGMIEKLCQEADEYNFCSVCVSPVFVALASKLLKESSVKVCTVIGFPAGVNEADVKAYETSKALQQGADEIDMVMNVGAAKAGNWEHVKSDIEAVVKSTQEHIVKVILETCLLSDDEKVMACEVCVEAGADFVKTSTGFNRAGATVEDIQLMRATVGSDFGVKASGGGRDYETACKMIEAGATRLGTSSGVKIIATCEQPSAEDD